MGLMQLLKDETYRELIKEGMAFSRGRGELMVGIGDTSLARTRERLKIAEEYNPDAVVVITPFFYKFSRQDLIGYFKTLASESKKPLFLYYLPGLTGVQMDLEMAVELSLHPNIQGVKCSCDYAWAHQLRAMTRSDFRIIPAQPHMVAPLARAGVTENLDGIFAVVPSLMQHLVGACAKDDWTKADEFQTDLSRLLQLITSAYPIFPACEAIINAQGIRGRFCPGEITRLTEGEKNKLLAEPIVRKILALP
jgi:dihydrodipicolinate synthase/N-acetylneuraminate lyase